MWGKNVSSDCQENYLLAKYQELGSDRFIEFVVNELESIASQREERFEECKGDFASEVALLMNNHSLSCLEKIEEVRGLFKREKAVNLLTGTTHPF
jgi:hypothetical protein